MKIAIIGTAGRKEDGAKLNKDVYTKMVRDAEQQLITLQEEHVRDKPNGYQYNLDLVSGGSAWADHIAVSLYLMDLADSLTLYFPCGWHQGSFEGIEITRNNQTARTANYYHSLFSKKMGKNTLLGIQRAIDKGATYHEISGGFFARNLLVGKVDVLLAYTFGEGEVPKPGGTKHTWDNSVAGVKIHRSIGDL